MITPEDLKGVSATLVMHMSMSKGGSHYLYRCDKFPRVTKRSGRETRRHPFITELLVDGFVVAGIAEACAALNRTPEENAAMADGNGELKLTGGAGEKKWSLKEGVAEIKREQFHRGRVYPRLVASGQMTEADAIRQDWALAGVLNFLEFCAKREPALREFMAQVLEQEKTGPKDAAA